MTLVNLVRPALFSLFSLGLQKCRRRRCEGLKLRVLLLLVLVTEGCAAPPRDLLGGFALQSCRLGRTPPSDVVDPVLLPRQVINEQPGFRQWGASGGRC